MKHLLRKFTKSERGVALIEFAIVVPFLLMMLFAGIEVARYALIIQKVQKASYALTDIVAQYASPSVPKVPPTNADEISVTKLNTQVFPLFDRLMSPFGSNAQEMVVFSSVIHKTTGNNLIRWQRISNSGSLFTDVTSIVTNTTPRNISRLPGTQCQYASYTAEVANLINPGGTSGAFPDENMIVGEVYFRYQPIMGFLLGVTGASPGWTGAFGMQPRTITRRIFIHPRSENGLLDLPPDSPTAVPPVSNDCPNS